MRRVEESREVVVEVERVGGSDVRSKSRRNALIMPGYQGGQKAKAEAEEKQFGNRWKAKRDWKRQRARPMDERA